MEEQEHKISSYIEQQEEFKSTVRSFVCYRLFSVLKSSLCKRVRAFSNSLNYNYPQFCLVGLI